MCFTVQVREPINRPGNVSEATHVLLIKSPHFVANVIDVAVL